MNDTGLNIPERPETLKAQQAQLLAGLRLAQMFPVGTRELPLPVGFARVLTARGVFHFNPERTTNAYVREMSGLLRENELLAMGPFNKMDVAARMRAGERLLAVIERAPDGTEIKAVTGTISMLHRQVAALEASKLPDSVVCVESTDQVLAQRRAAYNQGMR